jgi:hypothetical protein
VAYSRYYPGMCEGSDEATKCLTHYILCSGRDSNRTLPQYGSRATPLFQPVPIIIFLNFIRRVTFIILIPLFLVEAGTEF